MHPLLLSLLLVVIPAASTELPPTALDKRDATAAVTEPEQNTANAGLHRLETLDPELEAELNTRKAELQVADDS